MPHVVDLLLPFLPAALLGVASGMIVYRLGFRAGLRAGLHRAYQFYEHTPDGRRRQCHHQEVILKTVVTEAVYVVNPVDPSTLPDGRRVQEYTEV